MPGAEPHSHCYCGHQFGSFAGQLGDGAAMYLGEVEGPSGRYARLCVVFAQRIGLPQSLERGCAVCKHESYPNSLKCLNRLSFL